MSVARSRLVIVVTATLGTAAVVSVSGLIGFVGLVIPHVIRLVAGASYRRLLPLSLMFGATFLILADVPGRMLTNPGRDADRRGHRVHRCAVLHLPAADQAGAVVSVDRVRRRQRALRQAHRRCEPFSDRVESGEWLGVIGPNGAGKSSLLRAHRRAGRARRLDPRRRPRPGVDVASGAGDARGLRAAGAADPRRHERVRLRAARPDARTCRTSGSRVGDDRTDRRRGASNGWSWSRSSTGCSVR